MTTPTSASLIAAANDQHLQARVRALAATLGWEDQEIDRVRVQLVAEPINANGDTIASVYEYAVANYAPVPEPGEDPASVTDAYILDAIQKTLGSSSGGGAAI